jgi:peptidyl-tRNA hydrolase
MSDPLATVFHGDLNIETGFDTTEFGFGDLNVNRGITMNSSFSNASSVLSLNATGTSNVSTSVGTITYSSTDTSASGIVHLTSAGTAVNAVNIDTATGGFSIDSVKNSNINITSAAASTLSIGTSGDTGNKIVINTVTSTASDAITLDSDLGGVRINSDGVAGGANGIVMTAIDDSSFTTTDGKITVEVNSSSVGDKLELVNTLGTETGSSGAGAIDINAVAGGVSIDSVLSSRVLITSSTAEELLFQTTGDTGNKIRMNTVTSTESDAINIDSDLGGVRINSDGVAGGANGIVMTAIDDSSFTTTDGKITVEVNSSSVGDKLELVNTLGTETGSSGAGAIDINAVAGGVSIDSVLSSRVLITSSTTEELLFQTSGDTGNKIRMNTVTSTASDAITLDSDLGGVRINSDGVAGGANGIVMTAIDDSSFTTTDGKITVEVNSSSVGDKLELVNTLGTSTGSAGAGAIDINAVAGGVSIDSVLSSRFLITSSTTEELLFQTSGDTGNKITLNTVTSTASDAINIDSDLGGVRINSDGVAGGANGIVMTAIDDSSFTTTDGSLTIHANSSTVTDDLVIKNTGGTNVAAVDISAVAGGFSIDSVISSNMTITSSTAANLSIGTTGNVGNTVSITTATSTETNSIDIDSAAGGVRVDAAIGIVMTAVNDSSLTTSGGSITLEVNSSDVSDNLELKNTLGTETDAVHIEALSGGILIDANGGSGNSPVSIQTDDATNGISIGTTTAGIPVMIGTATSTTTILGNMVVSGISTTINTNTLTIEDNIILVNSGPTGTSDGGVAVKRFQGQNDAASGDVIGDMMVDALSSSHAADGFITSATATTVVFNNDGGSPPSGVDDYYNGWWILITAGTGVNQVRRIADYVGSTRTATIFTTANESASPQIPSTGADWTVTPSPTDSTYSLYSCGFVVSMFDESAGEWVMGCTSLDPATSGQPVISHYVDLHVKHLQVDGDMTIDGTINNIQPDVIEVVTLVDNATTAVEVTNTSTYGTFHIYVKEVASNSVTAATVTTGTFAVFSCAGRSGKAGNASRLAQASGANNEKLDVEWNSGEKIKIKYRPAPSGGAGGNRYYLVRVSRHT